MNITGKTIVGLSGRQVTVRRGFRDIPCDTNGKIAGAAKKNGHWYVELTLRYQKDIMFSSADHVVKVTLDRFNRCFRLTGYELGF